MFGTHVVQVTGYMSLPVVFTHICILVLVNKDVGVSNTGYLTLSTLMICFHILAYVEKSFWTNAANNATHCQGIK